MAEIIRNKISALQTSIIHVLSAAVLLCGFNVCIAIAALVTGILISGPDAGLGYFHNVMSLDRTGLADPIRNTIVSINWLVLGAFIFYALSSVVHRLISRKASPTPAANVLQFPPVRREDRTKKAANI